MMSKYQELLAQLGVGGAHPGGLELTKEVLKQQPIKKDWSVLDVGCGTGQTSAYIAQKFGCHVTALDIHLLMLQKAKERFYSEDLEIEVVEGNVENLPFPNNQFDMIIAESVTIFTNITNTLKEYFRVLKPAGVLLDQEMVCESSLSEKQQSELKNLYGVERLLTSEDWEKEIKNAGFHNIHSKKQTIEQINEQYTSYTEFQISNHMNPALFDVLEHHQKQLKQYNHELGHCIYSAEK